MDGATKVKTSESATISSTTWLQRWPQTSRELLKDSYQARLQPCHKVANDNRGFSRERNKLLA